jgi:AsmA protein
MKRILKVLGVTLGVVVVLVGAAFLLAYEFLDLDKVINAQIAAYKPQIEQRLGRKVEIGQVSTSIFPLLGGKLSNVTIEPDSNHKEDDRPLLRVGDLGFEVSLLDALLSGGKHVHVTTIFVDGLQVNLVRYPDGTLSYQDILDRQPKSEPSPTPEQPEQPLSPEVQQILQGLSIDSVRISEGQFRLVDHDTPTHQVAENYVKHFNVELNNVRLTDAIKAHVDAAVFEENRNFEFDLSLGPLPADLKLEGLPKINSVALKTSNVDLARVAPYLGKAVPVRLKTAVLNSNYSIGAIRPDQPAQIEGFVEIKQVQIENGHPFDFRLDSKLKLDLAKLGADIEKLQVHLDSVEISMGGIARDLASSPSFTNFTVQSSTINPHILLDDFPNLQADMPDGVKLDGTGSLDVKASGGLDQQTVTASLELGGLDIRYPGKLNKPKGVPMGLHVEGDFTKTSANLHKLEVVLDELDVTAQGTVKNFAQPTLDISLGSKPFSFDRLVRLLPEAADELQQNHAQASGSGKLDGSAKGTLENLDAKLDLALTGTKLDLPDTHVGGDLVFKALAKGDVHKALHAEFNFDAGQAVIVVPGMVNKTATTPLLLACVVDRNGELIDVKNFALHFGELLLDANGTFDLAHNETRMKLTLSPLNLEKFSQTVTAIPAERAKGGFINTTLALSGDPNKLDTLQLAAKPLDLRYGQSDMHGSITLANLIKPTAQVNLSSNFLDIDELYPPSDKKTDSKKSAPKQPAAEQDDPKLKDYTFSGLLDVKRMLVRDTELKNFRGQVKLINGVLYLDDCTFEVFGGIVSAKGTTAEIWRGRMPYKADLTIKGIDMNQALTAKTQYKDTLYGKGDLNVRLSGNGFETNEMAQTLSGTTDVSLTQARFSGDSLLSKTLGPIQTVLSKVPGLDLKSVPAENAMNDVAANFQVHDGKLNLAKPVNLSVDGNKLNLNGAIGITGDLFLTGTFFVSPQVVSTLTASKCSVKDALPVPVSITGGVKRPNIVPDAASVAQNLVKACLEGGLLGGAKDVLKNTTGIDADKAKAEAEKKLEDAKADAAAKAKAQADAAASRAKADADVAASKAKADADAKAKAAEAEADRKKQQAEDAAKKKAQDALHGLGLP